MGMADDVLTALLLARTGPVLAAPAMNDAMYAHAATVANLKTLLDRGWALVGPEIGPLAEGPSDRPGRMTEPETILAAARRVLAGPSRWSGRRVVVTAGPTRERLDPVRVLTNPSSGRMGFALAEAATARGAEMQRATYALIKGAAALFMAAAPADFRPTTAAATKQPRGEGALTLKLEPTPDILGTLPEHAGCLVIGFALETGGGVDRARTKLREKRLDYIILNDALEPGAGFEVTTNRVTIVPRRGDAVELPLLSKRAVAEQILDFVEQGLP
jgi:phosphopantothenoylcysteine decarboxylase/phosphopantothenate--cysteine ligase